MQGVQAAFSPAGQAVLRSIHALQICDKVADTPAYLTQLRGLQELEFTLAWAPKRNRRSGSSSSGGSNAQPPGPHLLSLQGVSALRSLAVNAPIITCSTNQQARQRAVQARVLTAIGRLTQLQEVVFDGPSTVWPAAGVFAPLAQLSGLRSLLLEYTEAQEPSGLEQLTDLTGMLGHVRCTRMQLVLIVGGTARMRCVHILRCL
jgi:hypothetical protein